MGTKWSQSSHEQISQSPTSVSNSTTLKRKRTPHLSLEHTNLSPQANLAPYDTTPDGDTHRYIVRCSAIFWCTRKDIARILGRLEGMPSYGGLHKIPKWDYFFINFPNSDCAERGVICLNSYVYRGESWSASPVTEHSTKRMRLDEDVRNGHESATGNMVGGVCLTAADVTAKWRDLPYDEQIRRKMRKIMSALSLVTKNMKKELRGRGSVPWLTELMERNGKGNPACCPLIQVVSAEEGRGRKYYRNKNEFTIGMSPDACGQRHGYHKSEMTIGYSLGPVRDGQLFVGEVDENCLTSSEVARGVARCLTPVVRSSGLEHYDKRAHKGYWRQITCREGTRTGHVIVSVSVNPAAIDLNKSGNGKRAFNDQQCRNAVIEALCKHFGRARPFGIFWLPSNLKSAVLGDTPAIHLYGIEGLVEELCGLRFRVQPTAFFQVNTIMAEKLYNLIGDMANVTKETVILDVCCGTGTIGLSLARRVHSVIGIEMNESAVADAEWNAKTNGIQNAVFISGKVEHRIHDAIKEIDSNRECVVILDPPRAGLPMNVVAAVRAMKAVHRVVYVACEPDNFWKNALGFCRPRSKAFKLEPFSPVKAYGMDLFPHTNHVELAVLLVRETNEEVQEDKDIVNAPGVVSVEQKQWVP